MSHVNIFTLEQSWYDLHPVFFPVMGKDSSVSPTMTVVITRAGACPFILALFLLTISVVLILSLTLLTVGLTFNWVLELQI